MLKQQEEEEKDSTLSGSESTSSLTMLGESAPLDSSQK